MKEEKNNIILMGMPGSGKTTVGVYLSDVLNYKFADLDIYIENQEGMKISEIFKTHGEEYFRKLEKEALITFENDSNVVLSTGGGTVKDINNIDIIRKIGTSFYLEIMPDKIYKRIKDDKKRPLLQVKNPLDALYNLYEERCSNYEMADYTVNADKSVDKIVNEIIKIYENIEC